MGLLVKLETLMFYVCKISSIFIGLYFSKHHLTDEFLKKL